MKYMYRLSMLVILILAMCAGFATSAAMAEEPETLEQDETHELRRAEHPFQHKVEARRYTKAGEVPDYLKPIRPTLELSLESIYAPMLETPWGVNAGILRQRGLVWNLILTR